MAFLESHKILLEIKTLKLLYLSYSYSNSSYILCLIGVKEFYYHQKIKL